MEKLQAVATDSKMDIGTILKKNNINYLVIYTDILNGGHAMELSLIRIYNNWNPLIRIVKHVYDEDISKYTIIKY